MKIEIVDEWGNDPVIIDVQDGDERRLEGLITDALEEANFCLCEQCDQWFDSNATEPIEGEHADLFCSTDCRDSHYGDEPEGPDEDAAYDEAKDEGRLRH